MPYGSRARIGYTCPIYLAEIFPYDFYKIVPDGVSLITATASVWQGTPEEMKRSAEQSLAAAREMAKNGANVVVIGGVPVGFAAGFSSQEDMVNQLQKETGVPFTASLLCQNAALKAVGANKLAVLRSGEGRNDRHMQEVEALGCTIVAHRGMGHGMYREPLTAEKSLEEAHQLLRANPGVDTLHCPSPHWPMAANIQALEDEFHINVVTSGQAITWHALRLAGIKDSIAGYGRLLRDL